MSISTPVVTFIWSDDTSAAALDAFFSRKRRRTDTWCTQLSAFIAARGPQPAVDPPAHAGQAKRR